MMTKKKSILFQVLFLLGLCGLVIGILILTGCGDSLRSNELEAVAFDGDEYFATSNIGNLTNREAFDLMIANPDAIFVFLNLVDEVMLRGNFEIDYDKVVEFWEDFKVGIPDVEAWMIQSGFTSEEEIYRVLELEELRQAAVYHLVEVTDEEVEEIFEMWFDAEEYEFEDVRDEIYDSLVAEASREVSMQELARLRYEGDFVIFNETLEAAYIDFLEMFWITDIDTHEAPEVDSEDVIARVNGVNITIGQVFAALSTPFGLELFDENIITARFSADPAEAYEALLDEFFTPSEERLREMHAQLGATVSGSHILVEDYDVAVDLISHLQDADDFSHAFAELAALHSMCPSGESGGDLGSWEYGQMVSEFDDAIFALHVGEFTLEPVGTQFGYHIIYKTGAAEIPEFEDVREQLMAQEIAQMQQIPGAFDEVLASLRQEVELEFTNPALQARLEFYKNFDW